MIFLDRLIRMFKNDIYLPDVCNGKYYDVLYNKKYRCKCKITCKFPKPGEPIILKAKV